MLEQRRRAAGPRIIASAMSDTWNSSKQMSRHRRAMRAATVASGSGSSLQRRELLVHVAHERMEMDARLAADRRPSRRSRPSGSSCRARRRPRDRRRAGRRAARTASSASTAARRGTRRARSRAAPGGRSAAACAGSSVVPRAARIGASHSASAPGEASCRRRDGVVHRPQAVRVIGPRSRDAG